MSFLWFTLKSVCKHLFEECFYRKKIRKALKKEWTILFGKVFLEWSTLFGCNSLDSTATFQTIKVHSVLSKKKNQAKIRPLLLSNKNNSLKTPPKKPYYNKREKLTTIFMPCWHWKKQVLLLKRGEHKKHIFCKFIYSDYSINVF